MTTKLPKADWDKVAKWWDSEAGNIGLWHQQHDIDPVIFKILGDIRDKRILEIGCGNGYFARLLAKKRAKIMAIYLSKERERSLLA